MSTPPFVVALPVAPAQRRGVLGPVLGFVVLGIAGLAAVGLVGTEVGVVGVVVGALCALLPVGPVVAVFLWIDRWEPEPPRMLLAAFGWGAGVAALVAIVLNSGAVLAVEALLGRGQGDVVGSVISAPLVEEFVKGAFLVGLVVRRRREFDGVVDGIVYAGITAAGFAFTENILYFGRAFLEVGSVPAAAVATTFVFRGLLSPFAHPLFTAMIGIGTGVAASIRSRGLGALAILAGYALAVVLHALWNAATQLGPGFFGVYLLIMLPMFGAVAGSPSGSGVGSATCSPGRCRGSPQPAGSRAARSPCCRACPGAAAGRSPCAGGPAARPPTPSWPTNAPSPSSRSCAPAPPPEPSRPDRSGTPSCSTPSCGPAAPR